MTMYNLVPIKERPPKILYFLGYLSFIVLIISAILGVNSYYESTKVRELSKSKNELNSSLDKVAKTKTELINLKEKLKSYTLFKGDKVALKTLTLSKLDTYSIYGFINNNTPDRVRVSNITIDTKGVNITGQSKTEIDLLTFINSLDKFGNVTLSPITFDPENYIIIFELQLEFQEVLDENAVITSK